MKNDFLTRPPSLSDEEKKRQLYKRQKELLDTFLSKGAISEAQYEKSLGDLTVKMGYAQNADKTK